MGGTSGVHPHSPTNLLTYSAIHLLTCSPTMISSIQPTVSSQYAFQSQKTPKSQAAALKGSGLDMHDVLELSSAAKNAVDPGSIRQDDPDRSVIGAAKAEPVLEKRELTEEDKRFRDVMHQFVGESIFGQMLKTMRASQEPDPFLGRSNAEEIFQSQLDQIYVEKITNSSSRSISDAMFNQMQRYMGKAEV